MGLYVRSPFESDRVSTTEHLGLTVPPAVDHKLINIARIQSVLGQGGDDIVKVFDGLIAEIVVPLLLLNTKSQSSVLDERDRSIMPQFDAQMRIASPCLTSDI
ncbi:hypothetical protein ABIF31_000551 [Bradyrhizobium elkanii]